MVAVRGRDVLPAAREPAREVRGDPGPRVAVPKGTGAAVAATVRDSDAVHGRVARGNGAPSPRFHNWN